MGATQVCFKVACGLDVHRAEIVACLSILEGHVRLIVGNPNQMKGLKGRKTDQQDAK